MTCIWTWLGDVWTSNSACPPGQTCPEPGRQGNYIGDQDSTACEGPG